MSTYNTTYNFNQGNMNFGQALLYGAFGSLTGGMGCFGGGYGMGMMSPFGMGGSLFSMMGMGGYGMGYGCDSMIGAQVGMSMANLAFGAISQAIDGRGSSKDERKAAIKESNDKIKTLTSEIEQLNKENSEDYVKEHLDKSFDTNIKTATEKYTKLKKEQKLLNGDENEVGSIKNLFKIYTDLKNKHDSGDQNITQINVDTAKAKYDEAVKRKAALDSNSGDDSVSAAKEAKEAAEKAQADEIKRIQAENQKVIDQKSKELNALREELYNLQQEQDSKIFNKADGTSKTRMNDTEFEKNFYVNGELNINDNNKDKIDKSVIQAAANHLVNAKTETERKRYSKEYIKLYDAWTDSSNKKGSLEKAYDLAKKYQ